MRKRFYFFILLLFLESLSCLFAAELYLAPYAASSNINLNTPDWTTPASEPTEGYNRFSGNRIVAIASIYHLEWKYYSAIWDRLYISDAKDYGIRITLSSNSYHDDAFWFVSQSNPDSQRPFQLQFAGPIRPNYENGSSAGDTSNNDYGYGTDGWIEQGNSVYRDIVIPEDEVYSKKDSLHPVNPDSYYFDIICDVGIILPGEINNGILSYNNNSYIIAPASDYSAEITIRIDLIKRDGSIVTESDKPNGFTGPLYKEYTIPFSGFYDPLIEGESVASTDDEEIGSSLSIRTLAGAGNIDLGNQSQKDVPIADINYAIYNLALTDSNTSLIDENVFIFLSASANPRVKDQNGFRFVHEDVGINESPTPENSINYTIKAISTEVPSMQPVVFDGTDYLEGDGLIYPGDKRLKTVHHLEYIKHTDDERHWHTFIGQLQLSLVPNPRLIVPGYYDSYVYVHVIVDDSLEVMQ